MVFQDMFFFFFFKGPTKQKKNTGESIRPVWKRSSILYARINIIIDNTILSMILYYYYYMHTRYIRGY